jgi:hypothetical protein
MYENISLLVYFCLLAKRLSLILLMLIYLFLFLIACIRIEGDLLFGLWCYMDIMVYVYICMYVQQNRHSSTVRVFHLTQVGDVVWLLHWHT